MHKRKLIVIQNVLRQKVLHQHKEIYKLAVVINSPPPPLFNVLCNIRFPLLGATNTTRTTAKRNIPSHPKAQCIKYNHKIFYTHLCRRRNQKQPLTASALMRANTLASYNSVNPSNNITIDLRLACFIQNFMARTIIQMLGDVFYSNFFNIEIFKLVDAF